MHQLKANLSGAHFNGWDLQAHATIRADLRGADLSEADGLDQLDLNEARGNAEAKIPEGLKRPKQSQ